MKNLKKNHYLNLAVEAFLYIGIFLALLYPPSDPDLGWHLKYGEYFFQNGSVLKENIYSALMPGFLWNNSSWGTDLITFFTFNNFGFIGLSVLGALTGVFTLFFMGRAAALTLFEKSIIFPIITYFIYPVFQASFRGQILSLLLLAILYFVLSLYEKNKKSALFLIPFFLLWGNLHGQYILGLGIFAIWFLTFSAKEIYFEYKTNIKKFVSDNKFLITSFFLSSLAILINPFGFGVYKEAIGHFDDPYQKGITEFLAPADFSVVWWHLLFAGIIIVLGIALLGAGKKNLDKAPFYIPSLVLYLFTFWIRRYAWSFYVSLIFLMQPVVKFFEPDTKKNSLITSFIISALFLILIIYINYPFKDIKNMNWNSYCVVTVNCSEKAADFVIEKKLNNEKLLTIYDYGGYLLWNYPQIKPTIDGRMHLWKDASGFSAFEYYYPIEQNLDNKDIHKTEYDAVLTSRSKSIFDRLVQLSSEGKWKTVYLDEESAVFIRVSKND